MRYWFWLSLFVLAPLYNGVFAQSGVEVDYEEEVAFLLRQHTQYQKAVINLDNGYRIQILATTDRMRLQDARRRFQNKYADRFVLKWLHEQPWYKLQVGAFQSQLEAQRVLYTLKKDYPGAYLTESKDIQPFELVYNW